MSRRQVLGALQQEGGLLAEAVAASDKASLAASEVADAEHELDLFVDNPKLLSLLGEAKFIQGIEVRQRALDAARQQLADLQTQTSLSAELADGDLTAAWPTLTTQERRRLMHGLLERVVLIRANGRGRQKAPMRERTAIVLRGGKTLA